jgi:thiol-disulfide isomerase/thioredoxin
MNHSLITFDWISPGFPELAAMFRHGFFSILAGVLLFSMLPAISNGQSARIIHWPEMQTMLADSTDSLTVINFWATWCKPCVQELPYFEKARAAFAGKPVRFRYISLDFASDFKSRLLPFISRKMPGAHVYLLDETDYNAWIDKVEPTWGGSIPITLFLNNPKKIRKFAPSELGYEQLIQNISSSL